MERGKRGTLKNYQKELKKYFILSDCTIRGPMGLTIRCRIVNNKCWVSQGGNGTARRYVDNVNTRLQKNSFKEVMYMGFEIEAEESIWLERELLEREAYISKELLPAAYEMYDMMEFFESAAVPTMFVNIRGRNYLLKKEELDYAM